MIAGTAFCVNDLDPVRWKNGGGTTRTLAVEPADAGFDNCRWRVSVAEVEASGSFSLFPGVDRTILLLEGEGMELSFEDGTHALLDERFVPYEFPGEIALEAKLLAGSVRDLNVMVRRGLTRARVQIWFDEASLPSDVAASVFFCPQGSFRIHTGTVLGAGDFLKLPNIAAGTPLMPVFPHSVLIGVLFDEKD